MQKRIVIILMLITVLLCTRSSNAQTIVKTQDLYGDLIRIWNRNGSPAELKIENSTKAITGGFLKNTGGGSTQFALLTASDIPNLDWSKITTGKPTTLAGYGITDAVPAITTITINGTTYDLSANRTWDVGTVTGTGTNNYLPKWNGTTALTNSIMQDDGTKIISTGTQLYSAINTGYVWAFHTSALASQYGLRVGANSNYTLIQGAENTGAVSIHMQPFGGNIFLGSTALSTRLGVAQTSPQSTLHVSGDGIITIASGAAITQAMQIQHSESGFTTSSISNTFNSNAAILDFRMKGTTSAHTVMRIFGSGNVAIGTLTDFGYKFYNNGTFYNNGAATVNGEFLSGTGSLDASAQVQANSTTKGAILPRMTTAQRDAISSPATGLLVTNTDHKALQRFDGSKFRTSGDNILFDHYTDATNSGTVETDLYSDAIPANILSATGEKIVAEFTGTMTNAGTSNVLKLYFAGTQLYSNDLVGLTGNWRLKVMIYRTGASTVRCVVDVFDETNVYVIHTDIGSITFSNTNILKVTGTNDVGGSSITAKTGFVKWLPAVNSN
jgi:hypothetical protein